MARIINFWGTKMESFKLMARQAKHRLGTDFWSRCKGDVEAAAIVAENQGKNVKAVKANLYGRVKRYISGREEDEFYLKVKTILDEYGETSDAIGRLIDRDYLKTLSYEEGQRYTMGIAAKYGEALERYRKEKL